MKSALFALAILASSTASFAGDLSISCLPTSKNDLGIERLQIDASEQAANVSISYGAAGYETTQMAKKLVRGSMEFSNQATSIAVTNRGGRWIANAWSTNNNAYSVLLCEVK